MIASPEHPHVQHRLTVGAPTVSAAVHRVMPQGLNRWLAIKITGGVSTMWAAYAFAALALVSAPTAFKSGDAVTIVAWISQTFLQLVLLAILALGQNVSAEAGDARAQATFDDATAILAGQSQLHDRLIIQDQTLIQEIARLEQVIMTASQSTDELIQAVTATLVAAETELQSSVDTLTTDLTAAVADIKQVLVNGGAVQSGTVTALQSAVDSLSGLGTSLTTAVGQLDAAVNPSAPTPEPPAPTT